MIRARTDAQNALIGFTEEAISSAIQKDRENFRKSTVINEIQKIGNFWPQFAKNLVYSLINSFVFTLFTIAVIFFLLSFMNNFSLTEMIKVLIQES